jgi:hypothetical protein
MNAKKKKKGGGNIYLVLHEAESVSQFSTRMSQKLTFTTVILLHSAFKNN